MGSDPKSDNNDLNENADNKLYFLTQDFNIVGREDYGSHHNDIYIALSSAFHKIESEAKFQELAE